MNPRHALPSLPSPSLATVLFLGPLYLIPGLSAQVPLDINKGSASSFDVGTWPEIVDLHGTAYFAANDGSGQKLWVSNGEPSGTFRALAHDVPLEDAEDLTVFRNALFFSGRTEGHDRELWVSHFFGTEPINPTPSPVPSTPKELGRPVCGNACCGTHRDRARHARLRGPPEHGDGARLHHDRRQLAGQLPRPERSQPQGPPGPVSGRRPVVGLEHRLRNHQRRSCDRGRVLTAFDLGVTIGPV